MTNNHTHLKNCSLNELFQWTSFQMQHALTHVLQHIIFNINWQQCFSPSHRHKGKQLTHQNFVFQALLTAKSMTALLRSKVLTANSSSLCSPSSSENHFHDLLSNNKTTKHAQLMFAGFFLNERETMVMKDRFQTYNMVSTSRFFQTGACLNSFHQGKTDGTLN